MAALRGAIAAGTLETFIEGFHRGYSAGDLEPL